MVAAPVGLPRPLHGLLAEEDPERLAVRLRVTADRAYDQPAGGLGEYGEGG